MNEAKPQAVVFDLGKVLLDFDYGIAIRRFLPRVKLSMTQITALINRSTLFSDYEMGAISTEEFFMRVKALSGYAGTLDEFGAAFGDIFRGIEPMIALHAELRQRRIPTYVLSNTNELAIRHIRGHYPFFQQFDGYVLSYEHRVMKPAPKIYEIMETLTGRQGADLLYLDDCLQNVEAARQRGWRAVLHRTPEHSRAAVVASGVLDPNGTL